MKNGTWLCLNGNYGKWRHCLTGNYVPLETSHDFHFRWIFLGGRVSGWTRKNTHSPKWTRNIFQLGLFIFQLDFLSSNLIFQGSAQFVPETFSVVRMYLTMKTLLAWFSRRFFCNGIDDLVKRKVWKPDIFEAPEFHGRMDFSSFTSPNFRSGWTPGRKRSGIQTRPGWWKNSWGGLFCPTRYLTPLKD